MTRTGLAPSLMSHTPEPMLTHASGGRGGGRIVQGGADAACRPPQGEVLLRADLRHTQRHGEVFAPMHWTDRFASSGPVGRVVSARVDPVSGQPELKATPATVSRSRCISTACCCAGMDGALPDSCHWVRVPLTEGQLYRFAGLRPMPAGYGLRAFAATLLGRPMTPTGWNCPTAGAGCCGWPRCRRRAGGLPVPGATLRCCRRKPR